MILGLLAWVKSCPFLSISSKSSPFLNVPGVFLLICSSFNNTVSCLGYTTLNDNMISEQNWKWCGRNSHDLIWGTIWYLPERIEENYKKSNLDSWCPGQEPAEHKSEALPLKLRLELLTSSFTVGSGSTSVSVPDFWLSWLRHFVQPPVHEGGAVSGGRVPGARVVITDTDVGGVLVGGVYVAEVQGWPRHVFFWWEHVLQCAKVIYLPEGPYNELPPV